MPTEVERQAAEAMPRVVGLLRAVHRRDWSMLARILRTPGWGEGACLALTYWLTDMVTGRPYYAARFPDLVELEAVRSIPLRALIAAEAELERDLPADLRICLAIHTLLGS